VQANRVVIDLHDVVIYLIVPEMSKKYAVDEL
jgi:ribosomal silencing factor RsfS